MAFVDFTIWVKQDDGRLQMETEGKIQTASEPPFSPEVVQLIRARVEGTSQAGGNVARRGSGETEVDSLLREKGVQLFQSVLAGPVGEEFRTICREAFDEKQCVRVRIRTSPELEFYPYEIMCCDGDPFDAHLALHGRATVVRTPADNKRLWKKPSAISPPMRILVVGAQPQGVTALDIDGEITKLKRTLSLPGLIELDTVLGHNTLKQLTNRGAGDAEYHVIHLICHGTVTDTQRGKLVLERADGSPDYVSGQDLAVAIGGIHNVRLVVLNSCLGSAGDGTDPFSAVATSVFKQHIPVVIAMQYEITDLAATTFAEELYLRLAQGQAVDRAITFARQEVGRVRSPSSPEWATPVLYMATREGDVLGLRVNSAQLVDAAKDLLREGNWARAKRNADIARESRGQEVEPLRLLTENSQRLALAWKAMERELRTETRDFLQNALEELRHASEQFAACGSVELLGEDQGACDSLLAASEAVRKFHAKEFDAAKSALATVDADIVDTRMFAKHVEDISYAWHSWDEIDKLWCRADWARAHDMLRETREVLLAVLQGEECVTLESRHRALEALGPCLKMLEDESRPLAARLTRLGAALAAISEVSSIPKLDDVRRFLQFALDVVHAAQEQSPDELKPARERMAGSMAALASVPIVEKTNGLVNYAAGCASYRRGGFHSAVMLLGPLRGYRKANVIVDLCQRWIEIKARIEEEQWSAAQKMLAEVRKLVRSHSDLEHPGIRAWTNWCRRGPKVLAALQKMVACPLVHYAKDSPYDVLARYDVTPTSSMEDCKNVGFELQKKRMTKSQREGVWDPVRLIEKRLELDFGLYRVTNSDAVAGLLGRLRVTEDDGPPGLSAVELSRALGEDTGIYRALRQDYEGAVDFFCEQAKRRPTDTRALHHLGLAAAGLIERHEASDDEQALAGAWDHLIVGWGAVFANDRFWQDWWGARRRHYGTSIQRDRIEEVRFGLRAFWLDRLKSSIDACPGMDVTFQVEFNGARAVAEGGGIPTTDSAGAGSDDDDRFVIGPLGAKFLGLENAVASWTESFVSERTVNEEWEKAVCLYFSDLAEARIAFDEGRFDETINALSELPRRRLPTESVGFPGFQGQPEKFHLARLELLEQSHHNLALHAASTSPMEMGAAIDHWKSAVTLAGERGVDQDLMARIREFVVGRARYLCQKTSDRGRTAIEDAVRLLEEVYERQWDGPDRVVRQALAHALQNQAVYLSNEFDDERGARSSARRAYILAPESPRSIEVLAMSSLHYAVELMVFRGNRAAAEALLQEVEGYLEQGRHLFPGNADLARCEKFLQSVGSDISKQATGDLSKVLEELRGTAEENQSKAPFVEAMVLESQKKFSEAVGIYWEIVQMEPGDRSMAEKLATCYHGWLRHAFETHSEPPSEIRRISEEARKRCPESRLLCAAIAKIVGDGEVDDDGM